MNINNMTSQLIDILEKDGFVEMETEHSILTIHFRKFFGTKKEFLFELNCKAVYSFKTKKSAINKMESFINKGFWICEN